MPATAAVKKPPGEPKPGLQAVPNPDEPVELVIEAGGQISLKVGGRAADESTILLSGGEVKLAGQYEKGQRLRFEIEGVVSQIAFTDLMDQKTGDVTATKRKHVLKLTGIKRVED